MTCVGQDDLKGKDSVQVQVDTENCVSYLSNSVQKLFPAALPQLPASGAVRASRQQPCHVQHHADRGRDILEIDARDLHDLAAAPWYPQEAARCTERKKMKCVLNESQLEMWI